MASGQPLFEPQINTSHRFSSALATFGLAMAERAARESSSGPFGVIQDLLCSALVTIPSGIAVLAPEFLHVRLETPAYEFRPRGKFRIDCQPLA